MSQALIDELKRENLCTHFVLPLLKLNKFSFTSAGFINSFLTQDLTRIAVQIVDRTLLGSQVLRLHPDFIGTYHKEGYQFVVYNLRRKWARDLELFKTGKYSQLSAQAKDYIHRYSGLLFQEREGDRIVTDGRLLALDKHRGLREMWRRYLYSDSDEQDADRYLPDEILSIPGKKSFIDLSGSGRIRETSV
jgi:hypothetical protein